MKQKILLLTILLIACIYNVNAQPFGGTDVLVSSDEWDVIMEPKLSVADNGWMYILEYNTNYNGWKLFRSKDNGFSYQNIGQYTNPTHDLMSCDLVVTGNTEANINVWIASLYVHRTVTTNSEVYIAKYNANGQWISNAYSQLFGSTKTDLYSVAISSDYRSPGAGAAAGKFNIGIAYTGYDYAGGNSFVDYVYSLNGGDSFTKKLLYYQSGSMKIGRIDLSYGSGSEAKFGYMGVVFEMDRTNYNNCNIGFLANYLDYDPNFKWTNPIQVNKLWSASTNKSGFPKIQWMLNIDANATSADMKESFLISFHEWSSGSDNFDVAMIYPKKSFKISSTTPVLTDFGLYYMSTAVTNQLYPDLSYDKANNHFLLTYLDVNKLRYNYVKYNKIFNKSNWLTVGNGYYSETTAAYPYSFPVVDINPNINNPCFAWTESAYYDNKTNIYADAQWHHVDVENIETGTNNIVLSPNPAIDRVKLLVKETGEYSVNIYDMQGKKIKEFNFNGNETIFNVNDLISGIYLIKVNSNKTNYSAKLIVN